MHDVIEAAWDARQSAPRETVRLAEPHRDHPDAELRARARAALAYATLRVRGADEAAALIVEAPRGGVGEGRMAAVRGAIHLARGEHADAVRCFRSSADLLGAHGHRAEVAGALINIAAVHRRIGDPVGAMERFLTAADAFRALDDRYGEAIALVSCAQVQADLGDAAAALPLMDRALEQARGLERPGFLAFVAANRGRALGGAAGIEALEEAVALADEAGVPQALAEALGHLGVLLLEAEPDRAREVLDRAVELVRRQGDVMTICRALEALGDARDGAEAYARYAEAGSLAAGHGEHAAAASAHGKAARTAPDTETELMHWRAYAAATAAQDDRERSDRLARLEVSALVAELRARDEDARRQIARLASAARRDSDLLDLAIHDLRGPLQVAFLQTELLAEDGHDVAALDNALTRLERILASLRRDVRSDAGRPQAQDLLTLVRAIVDERQVVAAAKGQRLHVEGHPVRVEVFPDRLFHAVDNLVGNALKFGPPDSLVVVRVLARDGRARIEVEDQGPGVPESERDAVFERGERGSAQATGGETSTGLGLYIARRMVLAHGGRIGVEDGARGARFWIEIQGPRI